MAELNIQIPEFRLKRYAKLYQFKNKEGKEVTKMAGIDDSNGPFDLF